MNPMLVSLIWCRRGKADGSQIPCWAFQKILPGWHGHLVSRTLFIRGSINETEQYVILGAGYDAKVHRLDFPHSLIPSERPKWINQKFRKESAKSCQSPPSTLRYIISLFGIISVAFAMRTSPLRPDQEGKYAASVLWDFRERDTL